MAVFGRRMRFGRTDWTTEVADKTVNVSRMSVAEVRMLRTLRRRMLEMPRRKAAPDAPRRPTSAVRTPGCSYLISFIWSSNFWTMM